MVVQLLVEVVLMVLLVPFHVPTTRKMTDAGASTDEGLIKMMKTGILDRLARMTTTGAAHGTTITGGGSIYGTARSFCTAMMPDACASIVG